MIILTIGGSTLKITQCIVVCKTVIIIIIIQISLKKFFFFDAQKLKLKQIASFKSREFFSYKSLYNKNGDFLFLQTSASSSNLRENHLFLFRKNHLFQVLTRHNIMDVNIKGEILAINYFDGDKGIIELCRLNSKQFDNWK